MRSLGDIIDEEPVVGSLRFVRTAWKTAGFLSRVLTFRQAVKHAVVMVVVALFVLLRKVMRW